MSSVPPESERVKVGHHTRVSVEVDAERTKTEGVSEEVDEIMVDRDEKDEALSLGFSTDGEVGEEKEMRVTEIRAKDSVKENSMLYGIMVMEETSIEVLEVSLIQRNNLFLLGSSFLIEEFGRKKFYYDWVQMNFLKVSKMLSVSFLGIESKILNLLEKIESRYQVEGGKKERKESLKKDKGTGKVGSLKVTVVSEL